MLQILFLSVIIIIGFLAVLLLSIVSKYRNGVKKKNVLLYVLVHVLVCGLIVFLGDLFQSDEYAVFMRLQVAALCMGIVHAAWMKKFFPWVDPDGFWPELWFTTSVVLFSSVGIMSVAYFLAWQSLGWLLPASMLLYATSLNIKIKAPERMELGHYFMSFIEQYNLRNPEKEIQIYDERGSLYGWVFYLKKPWYASSVIFDAEVTINDNGIRENQIIIAERIY